MDSLQIKYKNISYFSIIPPKEASGVVKKINSTVHCLNSLGAKSEFIAFDRGFIGTVKLISCLLFSNSDLIIIRFPGVYRTILLMPFIFISRLSKKKIVLDLPTPLVVSIKQIKYAYSNNYSILRIIPILIFYPWVLFCYNRIIHSGVEHPYFLFGIKNKCKLIGNGIDVNVLPAIKYPKTLENNTIVLIAVAQFEKWHGYDRLLIGLKNYYDKFGLLSRYKIKLILVGEGNEKYNLENYVNKNNLTEFVSFTGNLINEDLNDVFSNSNIAIGPIGSYRVGMYTSSTLKVREYTARGIPFIMADNDPDFAIDVPFILKVSNNDSVINVSEIINWYINLIEDNYDFNTIRSFAVDNLDYRKKILEMFF